MDRKYVPIVAAIALLVAAFGTLLITHHKRFSRSDESLTTPVAPDFSLQDVNGNALALSQFKGKVVLLNFWATWCAPCREEIPHFVALQDKYRDQGLQIIGISMDDGPKVVRDFYREYKMNYPVGIGTAKMAESYGGVLGLPVSFLIGRDGRIAAKYVGTVDLLILERQMNPLLEKSH